VEPALANEAPAARDAMSTLGAAFVLVVGAIVFLWYAPGAYTVYKALHVAAIVVWVDSGALAELGKMGAWIGTRVYTPTLFAVLGFGIALVEKGGYGWSTFWIDFALAGWTVATLVGVGFVGPELGRIDAAAQQHGPESPEVARRVKRLFAIFRFDTALLLLIVLDMTAKPSF
jgi:hypothetical protein